MTEIVSIAGLLTFLKTLLSWQHTHNKKFTVSTISKCAVHGVKHIHMMSLSPPSTASTLSSPQTLPASLTPDAGNLHSTSFSTNLATVVSSHKWNHHILPFLTNLWVSHMGPWELPMLACVGRPTFESQWVPFLAWTIWFYFFHLWPKESGQHKARHGDINQNQDKRRDFFSFPVPNSSPFFRSVCIESLSSLKTEDHLFFF